MDGRLKLTDEKVVFKSATKSGKAETIERNEIELVNWQRLAGTWGIRIFTKNGILHRFAGFKDSERDKLAGARQKYGRRCAPTKIVIL